MKKTFPVGNGVFGAGRPKICVPIVEKNRGEIWRKAKELSELPADIVEWRVDFYEDALRTDAVLATLMGLKDRLGKKPVLFTFRTAAEGGNCAVGEDAYYELNRQAARTGCAALTDVELFLNEARAPEEIRRIREAGSRVIASNHDFHGTPPTEEMVRRLARMEQCGADAAKLAVMPQCPQDVLNLLQATLTADQELSIPVVTMSMGSLGVLSRLSGTLTGSAMTFAAAGGVSAPGQIQLPQMEELLKACSV